MPGALRTLRWGEGEGVATRREPGLLRPVASLALGGWGGGTGAGRGLGPVAVHTQEMGEGCSALPQGRLSLRKGTRSIHSSPLHPSLIWTFDVVLLIGKSGFKTPPPTPLV